MVSGGQVDNDYSGISSLFEKYNSTISELAGSWNGTSYDNLVSKSTAFSSDYIGNLNSQMNYFARACDLYNDYQTAKTNLNNAYSNYHSAVNNKDSNAINHYLSMISSYKSQIESLKGQIESNLSSASSYKLEGNPNKSSNLSSGNYSNSATVNSAINWALSIADDNSYGYSQSTRWGDPNYDCSSFVISAYENAGVPVKENGATYTGNMRSSFENSGFTWIPGNPDVSELQPGDVLLSEGSHTEMYIGNGKNVGAHKNYDGSDGDSTGEEIDVGNYYNHPWDGVLRYTGNN